MAGTLASVDDSDSGSLAEEQQLQSLADSLQLITPQKKAGGIKRRLVADLSSDEGGSDDGEIAANGSPKRSRLLAAVLQTPPGTPVSNPFTKNRETDENGTWKREVVHVSPEIDDVSCNLRTFEAFQDKVAAINETLQETKEQWTVLHEHAVLLATSLDNAMGTLRSKISHAIMHVRQSEALATAERQAKADQARSDRRLLVAGLKPLQTKLARLKAALANTRRDTARDLHKLQQKAETAVTWVSKRAESMSSNYRSQARSNRALLQEALDDAAAKAAALQRERERAALCDAKLGLMQHVAQHAQQIASVTEHAALAHVEALTTALHDKQSRIDTLVDSLQDLRSTALGSSMQKKDSSSDEQMTRIRQAGTPSRVTVK